MTEFVLTDEQSRGIEKAKEWYLSDSKKPFVILGCAGSGKSTIVKFIIDNIGIDRNKNVAYVTLTGKAASVLIKKGNPAKTIHKLIYDPQFDEAGNVVDFLKKEALDDNLKLIVADEFFMNEEKIMDDLTSYGLKIICLGDNNQLPPPFGEKNKLAENPDVVLTQPLRQELDNPIIYLAQKAMNHERITAGDYGNGVIVVRKNNMPLDRMMNADQIIVGKNDTVKKFNKFYRSNFLGIKSDEWIPKKGEKLICLKNNWRLTCSEDGISTNLVNGLGLYNDEDPSYNTFHENFMMSIRPDFFENSLFKNVPVDALYFKHGFTKDSEVFDKANIAKYGYGEALKKRAAFKKTFENYNIEKLTYGYTITCHKSQGSEWEDVFFVFEPFAGPRDDLYWQMLYTGITRASKKLVLVI